MREILPDLPRGYKWAWRLNSTPVQWVLELRRTWWRGGRLVGHTAIEGNAGDARWYEEAETLRRIFLHDR